MNIQYVGEHLLIGNIGNLFIVISFVAAILSAMGYYFSAQNKLPSDSWQNIGRIAFRIHSLSVLGIIGTLFIIIFNHYFEYQYAWQHSSKALPVRYILSCFWEGQEGSFLLWTFWHIVLGNILIRYSGEWESSVMTVVSVVQIFLSSMLLGIYIFGYKLGSNPFLLLREHLDYANLPFVKISNYLETLDGRGLNPLLQNYWMTIHPPTLFLGFASTLVPFAYAIAGLWQKKYTEWLKPALPWTFFGVMRLGTGILMGGAWAYEALSFGGFWAWDPVENASLVPWLTFVGGAHVMVIYKNKGQSLVTTFFLIFLTFIFILYSTFLTRSGILGDTSVHAFTDLGMSGQLLVYLLFFVFVSAFLLVKHYKHLPKEKDEDNITSREFWMFIGALVLLISAFQIIFTTSIPVINKVFGSNLAPPLNPIQHYNSWQVPFAIIISCLIAIGQYFNYKATDTKKFLSRLLISILVSIVISVIIMLSFNTFNGYFIALCFTSVFAILANLNYLFRILKGNIKKAGPSIAHIGFGMILLGSLISTSQSETISINTSSVDVSKLGKDFSNNDNLLLSLNDTLKMGKYFVTYKGKKKEGINVYYAIDYLEKDANGKYKLSFTLNPLVQTNPRMGNIAEPDTRHFLQKDIYTHVTYAELEAENETSSNEFVEKSTQSLQIGDSLFATNSIVVLESLLKDIDRKKYNLNDSDIVVAAHLRITDINNKTYFADPLYVIEENYVSPLDAKVEALGLKFSFTKIDIQTGKVEIKLFEKKSNKKEFIVMKAIIFPGINILWLGCFLMIIGSIVAIVNRLRARN